MTIVDRVAQSLAESDRTDRDSDRGVPAGCQVFIGGFDSAVGYDPSDAERAADAITDDLLIDLTREERETNGHHPYDREAAVADVRAIHHWAVALAMTDRLLSSELDGSSGLFVRPRSAPHSLLPVVGLVAADDCIHLLDGEASEADARTEKAAVKTATLSELRDSLGANESQRVLEYRSIPVIEYRVTASPPAVVFIVQ